MMTTVATFWAVFVTVFIAELGDKTQLATIMYASDQSTSKVTILLAASFALICSTALGVLMGSWISGVSALWIKYISGAGFILMGCWTIFKA